MIRFINGILQSLCRIKDNAVFKHFCVYIGNVYISFNQSQTLYYPETFAGSPVDLGTVLGVKRGS